MGGVECWPARLTYKDARDATRTIAAGTVPGSGCALVLWGGDDRSRSQVMTDVWVGAVETLVEALPESRACPAPSCPG